MKKIAVKPFSMQRLKTAPAWLVVALLIAGTTSVGIAHASIQSKIDALNAKNAQDQKTVSLLKVDASNYQDAINKLQSQISGYQKAISANQAKQAVLQTKINADQVKLNRQKKVLGEDLKAMYVGGQMTTVEMLATSDNLSNFVDAETYDSAVQGKIQGTMNEITQLQNKLEDQQNQVQSLLQGEQAQRDQLASDQSQKNSLLAMNQAQQADYNNNIKKNNSEIAKLQAQQVAENEALFGGVQYGGTGSYPYANATCLNASGNCGPSSESPYNWGEHGQPYDPAGWQYRNCTSYAFWRLDQARHISLTAGDFPNVYSSGGRIGYSIPDFRNLGYRVDHNPAGATLVVEGAGPYGPGTFGHIMYDEGSYVSQYNEAGDGRFSTMPVPSGSGFWFVHIP